MKFWTFKSILNLVGLACAVYLTVLGFAGKLPPLAGAFGWFVVSINMFCDFLGRAAEHQVEKSKAETRELLEHLIRISNEMNDQCKCSDDCCGKGECKE